MKRVMIAGQGLRSWREGLAKPDLHWKRGASAFELAVSWELAQRSERGIPADVCRVLDGYAETRGCAALFVVPEHKVAMPGRGKSSQNDAWVLARGPRSWISIAVEGKVNEPFDDTIGRWLSGAPDPSNRQKRLDSLRGLLGSGAPSSDLRYQLFHRTASAIYEAQRCGATVAVLMIQSFGPMVHAGDVERFCSYLNAIPVAPGLVEVPSCTAVTLLIGWTSSEFAADSDLVPVRGENEELLGALGGTLQPRIS